MPHASDSHYPTGSPGDRTIASFPRRTAAVNIGVSRRAIMFRQILPNAMSPIIVVATLEVGNAIITESTLSSGQAPTSEVQPVIHLLVNDLEKKKIIPKKG